LGQLTREKKKAKKKKKWKSADASKISTDLFLIMQEANDDIRQQQMEEMMLYQGEAPSRGGRGGFRGRGGPPGR
jgi:hypothetical protein